MITLHDTLPARTRAQKRAHRRLLAAAARPHGRAGAVGAFGLYSVCAAVLAAAALTPIVGGGAFVTKTAAAAVAAYPDTLPVVPLPARARIVASDGSLIANTYTINRIPVDGAAMGTSIRQAIVAVEDSRFYTHTGVDPQALLRAGVATVAGGGVQGGSTITQQYVKNMLLTDDLVTESRDGDPADSHPADERSLDRKLREMKLAVHTERTMSKDDILTGYLNVAYFGAGAYGVQAASYRYFSLPANQLSVPQAAMLAGLVQSPTTYNPETNPQHATERRNQVLNRMAAEHMISNADAATYKNTPLGLTPSASPVGCVTARPGYGFVCDAALKELSRADWLDEKTRRELVTTGGYTLTTTITPPAQDVATAAAKQLIPAKDRVANAVVTVEPGTGNVLTFATNRDYGIGKGRTELLLPAISKFSPGSTFKLFTLVAALERGISLDTVLPAGDAYTSKMFDNPPGGFHNAEGVSGSDLSIREATSRSLNTAYVQLMEKTSVAAVADAARRLGITSIPAPDQPGAPGRKEGSFALGVHDVSVMDMAGAYAGVAAGGIWCKPHLISSVATASTTHTYPTADRCQRAIAGPVASTATSVLKTVVDKGTGRAAQLRGRDVAGKTGTAENLGAAWFAGYTPQAATVVWTGDPKSPKIPLRNVAGVDRVYGGTLPAALWKNVMTAYLAGKPALKLPGVNPTYLLALGPPGGKTTTVSNVVGLPEAQGRDRLVADGYQVAIVRTSGAPQQPANTIIATSPVPGTPSAPGTLVTLTLTE